MKDRHWNSKNREIKNLITKRGEVMWQMATERDDEASAQRLAKLEQKVSRKQRQIRENLRENRDLYWTDVAEQLEKAYGSKDMKLYYKLIKEALGPQLVIPLREDNRSQDSI